jgi:hypothetical protein
VIPLYQSARKKEVAEMMKKGIRKTRKQNTKIMVMEKVQKDENGDEDEEKGVNGKEKNGIEASNALNLLRKAPAVLPEAFLIIYDLLEQDTRSVPFKQEAGFVRAELLTLWRSINPLGCDNDQHLHK